MTYPKGGEQLSPGQDVMITWAADDAVHVELFATPKTVRGTVPST